MRPIERWAPFFSSTVQVAPRTSKNASAAPTYGTDVTYRAHLKGQHRMLRTADGQDVLSTMAVYLMTRDVIQPTCRLTLSTGDVGSTDDAMRRPLVVAVEPRYHQGGRHHVVVHLGA